MALRLVPLAGLIKKQWRQDRGKIQCKGCLGGRSQPLASVIDQRIVFTHKGGAWRVVRRIQMCLQPGNKLNLTGYLSIQQVPFLTINHCMHGRIESASTSTREAASIMRGSIFISSRAPFRAGHVIVRRHRPHTLALYHWYSSLYIGMLGLHKESHGMTNYD